jgi:hypothetical protein
MASESGGLKFKPGHAYFTVHNYSCLQKFIRSSSRNTDQWRRSPGWHIVGGILEPDKNDQLEVSLCQSNYKT